MNNSFLILSFLVVTICFFIGSRLSAEGIFGLDSEKRNKEGEKLLKLSQELAKFYTLPDDVEILEITDAILNSPHIKESRKIAVQESMRRVFVFNYPSDGLKIKGIISFVPNPHDHPTLIVLRGGNRIFGILNPANDLLCADQYTVIATTYRDGVSEGHDEFGGDDVNDVKNLIDFIPQLEERLNIPFQNDTMFMLGGSRGGMQMFLALARFPELQSRFKKVVSLSGLLDMRVNIAERPDMKKMFIEDFGLIEGVNEEEWINLRDPLLAADKINKNLPILIIQGTIDNRVSLDEGYHMVSKLQENGNQVTYWEIEGADHCLGNMDDRIQRIVKWFEE